MFHTFLIKDGVGEATLEDRGIRKGVEVLVMDPDSPNQPARKAIVLHTYPRPSRWFVVRYESGDIAQVEESQVTTMFEEYKKTLF
ncbi:MAG TPA: hypothetical protein VMT57_05110 [Candidatus Thermoplasmatota archaeon]|nr:hypothetical protein [Candidatus Thermoplasmatota archaeon]